MVRNYRNSMGSRLSENSALAVHIVFFEFFSEMLPLYLVSLPYFFEFSGRLGGGGGGGLIRKK
ncbi:MAG: hypothetical protein LBQ57_14225, partial [Spirochaetales bacterium]|nr:hypothetical protein [Spirochaetales bacterium]